MSTRTERVKSVYIEDAMKSSYIDYSMSVIVSRALPDVRDGLKPVHRRVLVAMRDLGLMHDRPYRKSAKITGDVTGNYHPHGTVAVYDTMVRMAQDFSMRYALVDGQGNFGSVDGDAPAAERYTEARLTVVAEEMLRDIEKNTVNFRPNYDETRQEPNVLPALVPNLLVNGAAGIAVGMATNIPPHNLGEICEAIALVIDEPETEPEKLLKVVHGPDFPTGGIILGRQGIADCYLKGRGLIVMRARACIETNEKTGRESIVVTEIPYQVSKAGILEKTAALVREGRITGISDIRDESDRDGMRIVIELKKDAPARVALNQLFKHTYLQTTFGANMLALVKNRPKVLTLREMIDLFIEHRQEVVRRRTEFDLAEAEKRAHILEGLKIALDNIDAVIALIKKAPDVDAAREGLMKKFKLSQVQAQAILDMRLQRLTGLERKKVEEEYVAVIKLIETLRSILASPRKIMGIIKTEVLELSKKHADERRTEIVAAAGELDVEDLIAEEDMVITISHSGYIKRLPVSTYRRQRRGGRGITGVSTKEEDFIEHLFIASTHSYILFLTDKGRCYWLKVHEIPQAGRISRGKAVVNMIQMSRDERISAFVRTKEFDDEHHLVIATRKGMIKKTILSAYANPRKAGIVAIGLDAGDCVIDAWVTDGTQDIILAKKLGKAIRFHEKNVRPMGRTARGVRGVSLEKGDEVVTMISVKGEGTLLVVTENGFGKRSPISEYRLTGRGGKGIITIKNTPRNGSVVSVKQVGDDDELMIITAKGVIIRLPIQGVSVMGRNTQGVRLIQPDKGDKVVDVARVVVGEEE
ncbi:MAG: DNA gyrase subunit A [Candidatus Eiseniibacteriota bacterium]|nr:MAG: DNA gyrase subunit A [Candidatus Eisenbacteria bacterium]